MASNLVRFVVFVQLARLAAFALKQRMTKAPKTKSDTPAAGKPDKPVPDGAKEMPKEIGGRKDGPEPTRYGDWEHNGKCVDF